jgi:toluene monooxygenase system protein D
MSASPPMSSQLVGPVLRTGVFADAVIEAIHEDNPGKEIVIDEHSSYVRIHTDGECVIRRATLEAILGRAFEMQEIELNMSAFSGQIDTGDDYVRFFLLKGKL